MGQAGDPPPSPEVSPGSPEPGRLYSDPRDRLERTEQPAVIELREAEQRIAESYQRGFGRATAGLRTEWRRRSRPSSSS